MAVLQRLQAAAGQLVQAGIKGQSMSSPDLKHEIHAGEIEPLLPVEKKLIGWSLGLGLVLLVVLIAINHFVPIKL
jgi:hypothetical protein